MGIPTTATTSAGKVHPPATVARRNARERNRVKQVRDHVFSLSYYYY